jgi:hypothetical protein
MLVRDLPLAADLSKPKRMTKPKIRLLSVGLCSAHPIKAVAEGNIAADGDIQIVNFVADRALPSSEPRLQTFRIC